jgi:ankyrin repeat protein
MKKNMAVACFIICVLVLVLHNTNCFAVDNPQATMQLKKFINYKILTAERIGEIRALIDEGANVDATVSNNITMLQCASCNGQLEIARLLLEKGAQVDKPDGNGMTPLQCATRKYSNLEIVKLLLEKEVQVDRTDIMGMTPLFSACGNGNVEMVKVLLSKGAQVNRQGMYGNTPLAYASAAGHLEVVKFLLANGAQVTKYAFSSAKLSNNTQIVELLKEYGAKEIPLGNVETLKIETLDFENPPDAKQLLTSIAKITVPALLQLGYNKASVEDYRTCFSAPTPIVGDKSGLTMMEAVSFFLIKSGHKSVPGDIETLEASGDRYTTTVKHAEGAAPSFYSIGGDGMFKKDASSTGAPGEPNKKRYRSADINYELIYYSGHGETRCEIIERKAAKEAKSRLTIAITKDGVSYLKSRDAK